MAWAKMYNACLAHFLKSFLYATYVPADQTWLYKRTINTQNDRWRAPLKWQKLVILQDNFFSKTLEWLLKKQ